MDAVEIIALRKIEDALKDGAFNNLPCCGRIECSVHGELFIAKWWREKIAREEAKASLDR